MVGCLKVGVLVWVPLLVIGQACLVSAAGSGDDPDPTSIVEVVMYGVDDDTHELLRYSFRTNEYIVLGEIRDDEGEILDEVEALGFIPSGPHKGLYGAANYGNNAESRLLKFNVFDAGVTVYPVPIGFGNVEGMVSSRHPESGEWKLYATQSGDVQGDGNGQGSWGGNGNGNPKVLICHIPPGNPANAHTILVGEPALSAHLAHGCALGSCDGDDTVSEKNLIEIDPATGLGEMVMQLGERFEGLAQGPNGVFYAAADDELWAIDLYHGTKVEVGFHDQPDVEALEYAYGDYDPQVEVPGVPPAWTAGGALFGFSDETDTVLVLNPATGDAVEYECALDASDLEGMVFMTEMNDPYTWIVALPCD
jgi:hypothetical protein